MNLKSGEMPLFRFQSRLEKIFFRIKKPISKALALRFK